MIDGTHDTIDETNNKYIKFQDNFEDNDTSSSIVKTLPLVFRSHSYVIILGRAYLVCRSLSRYLSR